MAEHWKRPVKSGASRLGKRAPDPAPEPAAESATEERASKPPSVSRPPDVIRIDTRPRSNASPLGLPGKTYQPETDTRMSMTIAIVLGLGVAVGGGLLYRYTSKPSADDEVSPGAVGSASSTPREAKPPVPARCTSSGDGYVLGEAPKQSAHPAASAGPSDFDLDIDDAGVEDSEFSPFAVVLGRAVATESGYFVGALRDGEGGSLFTVASLNDKGEGHVTRLLRARGDLEPPVVAGDGSSIVAAMAEPNAGGFALKLARVTGDKVDWGAEVGMGREEAGPIDIAISGERGLVVRSTAKEDVSSIQAVSFKRTDLGNVTAWRTLSKEKTDADRPRLVAQKDGYFLVYIARAKDTAAEDAKDPKKEAKKPKPADDEIDESRGERVLTSWIEAIPLDKQGSPRAEPEKLTPRNGHITGFDVASYQDGFLLAWRDEDSPSGGAGGQVSMMRVTLGGPSSPSLLSEEHAIDRGEGGNGPADQQGLVAGVPVFLDGWIALPSLRGPDSLGQIDPSGHLIGKLSVETSLGLSAPLASKGNQLFVAEPMGKAVRLRVLTCSPK